MDAHARLTVDQHEGVDRVIELRSDPPVTLRQTGACEVNVVGSAAGPVGGDTVRLDVTVRDGATLNVRSIAATLLHPGPQGEPIHYAITVDVGRCATLRWTPEPAVLIAGCDARISVAITLARDSRVLWRDEVQLGRWNETTGSLLQRVCVDRGGEPLLRNELAIGPLWPGWDSPAAIGDHAVVSTSVAVGWPTAVAAAGHFDGGSYAVHPLAPDATAWTVLGQRVADVRRVTEMQLRQ